MSRLNDLLRQLEAKDPALARDLRQEYVALADRRAFGLNFERHTPEVVELPGRKVRRGDKVHVLPERGKNPTAENSRLWRVVSIDRVTRPLTATIEPIDDSTVAPVVAEVARDRNETLIAVEDLVVAAEFRDPIYPGLVSTGRVERGGDRPFHAVINAENYHALQMLLFTHRGRVDCIYIDPPYNSGARDWKYSNDYVEGDDHYRHSKWLAFMERRLRLARDLLKPDDSVVIVTIDEKEVHRLGLLLEQTFPDSRVQMISTSINPKGVARGADFYRVDEYVYVVFVGAARVAPIFAPGLCVGDNEIGHGEDPGPVRWGALLRSGSNARRADRPSLHYPIFVDRQTRKIVGTGVAPALGDPRPGEVAECPEAAVAIWPIRRDGTDGRWQLAGSTLMELVASGYAKVSSLDAAAGRGVINYLPTGILAGIANGSVSIVGRDENGVANIEFTAGQQKAARPRTQWNAKSHSASEYGTTLLRTMLPGRTFPFPKSLYALEDVLRFFVLDKEDAVVLDFFGGSGTTAHAVMRLNRQLGGRRQSIIVTNNEVSADEQKGLRKAGLRPGDPEWEAWGICDYITKPRIKSAVAGRTPEGSPILGDYRFTDEFPLSEGLEQNVEFFTLTYEAPLRVSSNREFARVAPLLWMRAGSRGRRIDEISAGWEVADSYGVLADLDQTDTFLKAVAKGGDDVSMVFVVTDEDRLFQSVVRELPDHVEAVRLYEAYLRNFEIESGRSML